MAQGGKRQMPIAATAYTETLNDPLTTVRSQKIECPPIPAGENPLALIVRLSMRISSTREFPPTANPTPERSES
jgi:hypothetical protein